MVIAERIAKLWPKALSIDTIRGRLALFLALALLPAGAIAIQTGVNTAASRSLALADNTAASAQAAAHDGERLFSEMADVLRVLATARGMFSAPQADCQRALTALSSQYRDLGSIALMDRTGLIRCRAPVASPGLRARSNVFTRAQERGALSFGYIQNPLLSEEAAIGATNPLRDEHNAIIGYVGLTVPFPRLREVYATGDLDASARAVLVDANGQMIAPGLRGDGAAAPVPPPEIIRAHLSSGGQAFQFGRGNAALVAPLHAPDVYAVISWRPPSQSLSDRLAFGFAVISPLLMWVIAIGVGWVAIEAFVSRPLLDVEQMARDYVRGGDLSQSETIANAPTEIRDLTRTLTAMARTLRAREHRLGEALKEERALLREVHHRVKNNLQVVASLLSIQARAAADSAEAWGLARAHDRIQLLSTVHQRIYSSGEVREVQFDLIAADIARQLISSRGGSIADIDLDLHIDEVRCDVDRAVPLGFLLGESLSNALDHAPPRGREKLSIRMTQDSEGGVRFTINAPLDKRLAHDPDPRVRLIDAFARQLGAEVARDANGRYRVWASAPQVRAAIAA